MLYLYTYIKKVEIAVYYSNYVQDIFQISSSKYITKYVRVYSLTNGGCPCTDKAQP